MVLHGRAPLPALIARSLSFHVKPPVCADSHRSSELHKLGRDARHDASGRTMAGMTESCSVCATRFDVQFRYQMEERDGALLLLLLADCHGKAVRGETTGGATCAACAKRFQRRARLAGRSIRGERRYACSVGCRRQLLAEASGARLGDSLRRAREPPREPNPARGRVPASSRRVVEPRRRHRAIAPVPRVDRRAPPAKRAPARRIHRRAAATIAVFNHKGGTGKTTTAVSIAAGPRVARHARAPRRHRRAGQRRRLARRRRPRDRSTTCS